MRSAEDIIERVATVTGIPMEAITGRRRTEMVCVARFLAIAAVREACPFLSLQETAEMFGRADHGTVLHALKRHRALMQRSGHYCRLNEEITHLKES